MQLYYSALLQALQLIFRIPRDVVPDETYHMLATYCGLDMASFDRLLQRGFHYANAISCVGGKCQYWSSPFPGVFVYVGGTMQYFQPHSPFCGLIQNMDAGEMQFEACRLAVATLETFHIKLFFWKLWKLGWLKFWKLDLWMYNLFKAPLFWIIGVVLGTHHVIGPWQILSQLEAAQHNNALQSLCNINCLR